MPTFEQSIENRQIIIQVALSRGPEEPRPYFRALVDTGATVTCISPNVVKQLQLAPTGRARLAVASGQTVPVLQYHARVDIPIVYTQAVPGGARQDSLRGNQLTVVGLIYQPDGYDVLLGMDLLGEFHITIYRNRIIVSN